MILPGTKTCSGSYAPPVDIAALSYRRSMWQRICRTSITDEISDSDPNPQNVEYLLFGESRWRVGFSLLLVVFALLADALAFGALGNLPGAPAADLTMTPPASIAAAPSVPSRNNGISSSSS